MKSGTRFLLVPILLGGLSLGGVEADCQIERQLSTNQKLDLNGWLGYSPNGLDPHIRNLSTGEDKPVYNMGGTEHRFVPTSHVGSEFTLVDRKGVIVAARGRSSGLYLVRGDKITILVEGDANLVQFRNPVFFAAHSKLVYVRREESASGDWSAYLYEAVLKDDQLQEIFFVEGQKAQVDDSIRFLVKISDDESLFQNNDGSYVVYNLSTRHLTHVPVYKSACVPAVWRSKTQELVCGGMGDWYLLDLKGNKRAIPGEVPQFVNAYVPSDYLIGSSTYVTKDGCQHNQAIIYDFESGKSWLFEGRIRGRGRWYDAW